MKAFPKSASIELGQPQTGINLRDYFAAKALNAILSLEKTHKSMAEEKINAMEIAQASYAWADAMMEARK